MLISFFILTIFISRMVLTSHVSTQGGVMVASVSTDGKFAITTDDNKKAVLWDLENKRSRILDANANVYSAYFIKNTHDFMWQHDSNNEVYIQNTKGETLKKFNPGFATYGQAISSDFKYYVTTDVDWNLYEIQNNKKKRLMYNESGFYGAGKLLNLTIFQHKLLISGYGAGSAENPSNLGVKIKKLPMYKFYDDVITWNLETGYPIYDFRGNVSKTYATLDPTGEYVVGGDEATNAYLWDARTGRVREIPDPRGIVRGKDDQHLYWDTTGFPKIPRDFFAVEYQTDFAVLSIKFITNTEYLRFTTYIPYAILYSIENPKPLKYLRLDRNPLPSVGEYDRNAAIDTSPQAHILVMGKELESGILVYKYDPKKQTLKKIWDGA